MRALLTIWIIISVVFIWFSYEPEQPNEFYNILGLNSDIKKKLDIDLLAIKNEADKTFKNDTSFYIKLLESRYDLSTEFWFESAGIPFDPINSKGVHLNKSISIERSDSLGRLMMMSFADNIKMKGCDTLSKDSLCIYKMSWYECMRKTNPLNQAMYYGSLHKPFVRLKNAELLSDDEINYLVLFIHYLGELTSRANVVN